MKVRWITLILIALTLGFTMTYWNVYTHTIDKVATTTINEDDPNWNCLTMGNHICGTGWVLVPDDIAYEEGLPDGCLLDTYPGDTPTIACPDGTVR